MPLRFPRPVMALIATGAAAVSICLSAAMPASADQFRGANSADLAGAVTNVGVTAVALAAPPAPRASAGALPREAPGGAPPSSSAQNMGTQILRSAEISGALLLCLLLLIVAYAAMGRRRRRDGPAVAAEWMHRPGQSRYPHAGSDADRMLELFAAPAAPPGPPVALRGPAVRSERYGPPPAGGGVFAPATGREPSAPAGHRFGGPATGRPTADASDSSDWLSHGPASRAVDRRASVSGVPPWEPAAAPDGELPWATAPGRHAGGPPADGPARPAPTYAADLGYDPAGRAGQFDPEPRNPEPRMGGYGPPPGATPPGGYRSPLSSGVPADPPAAWGYRSPTGSGAPSGSHSRPDYSPPADRTPPVGYGADAAEPRFAPSGLPVRQPQESWPPGSAPSPSGSLWEPASRDASQASEPTEYADQSYDEAGRPIFVWDRAMRRDPWQAGSGE